MQDMDGTTMKSPTFDFGGFVGRLIRQAETMPVCETCGPVHSQVDIGGQTITVRSACEHQEAALLADAEAKERQDRYEAWRARVGDVGRLLVHQRTPWSVPESGQNAQQGRSARLWAESFAKHRHTGAGLYLWGTVGTGKTTAAYAIASALEAEHYRVITLTEGTLAELLMADNDTYGHVTGCDLLILDDIGMGRLNRGTGDKLAKVIHQRHHDRRPIVATSNLSLDDLAKRYESAMQDLLSAERVVSRLRERMTVHRYGGQDMRGGAYRG